jgi:hypothetical protein
MKNIRLLSMAFNPIIATPVGEGGPVNADTLRNVRNVLRVTEQFAAAGPPLNVEDMQGLSLIIQCAAGAVEYELGKIEAKKKIMNPSGGTLA